MAQETSRMTPSDPIADAERLEQKLAENWDCDGCCDAYQDDRFEPSHCSVCRWSEATHEWKRARAVLSRLRVALEQTAARERKLRELLWLRHGHVGLYGDDGEMQCGRCLLDFKRDEPTHIEAMWMRRAMEELAAARPAPPPSRPDGPTQE